MLGQSASNVIHKMSTSLQIEVVMLVHKQWLDQIWFVRGAEPACLVQLALRMEPFVFAPGELPEPTNLYIIHRGIVMHGSKVLTSGRMWGEEMILDDPVSSTPTVARCMTYVEVYSLSRPAFYKVTNAFVEAKRLVRRRAVLVIARRALLRLVKRIRAKRAAGDGRSFIDLVLDAAGNANGSHLAKVVAATAPGGVTVAELQEDIAAAKASTDELRNEMQCEMAALREGLNRLLAKEGLQGVEAGTETRSLERGRG